MRSSNMLNFGCRARMAAMAAVLACVSACTARDAGWQRPNTTDAMRAADYGECRGEAKSVAGTALGIDQDIASSRGGDWRNAGLYDTRSQQNSSSDAEEFSHVLSSCMVGKGYRPR
jgi:hypothetical protein